MPLLGAPNRSRSSAGSTRVALPAIAIWLALLVPAAAIAKQRPLAQSPATVTAAEQLVRYLESEGVRKVFGVPGEETLHFVDALRRSRKIEFVVSGNEQGASLMATGYARATGGVGVVLSTLGPGATNLVTGAANALSEGIKLLLITGQAPTDRPDGYHQKIALTELFGSVTRLSLEPHKSRSVVAAARRLMRTAHRQPGPVHLSLPADVAARPLKATDSPQRASRVHRAAPPAEALDGVGTLLRSARFPVIVAGDGILRERSDVTAKEVLRFARLHGIPIVPSTMAKGMFPWSEQSVLPPLDASARGLGADIVRKADVILSVGYHPTETFNPKAFNPRSRAKVVQISPEALRPEQRIEGMQPVIEINATLSTTLRALHATLQGYRAPAAVARQALAIRHKHELRLAHYDTGQGSAPLEPQQVMAELRRALDGTKGRSMVFADIGVNKAMMTHWFQVRRPRELVLSNGLSTMGVALPSAIGAKHARPQLKVVSVSGDGGLMMNVQELAAAAAAKLPVVHVALIDGRLGLIENHQRRNGLQPSGVSVPELDIVALARGMGAKGHMVRDAREIAPLVQKALQLKGPTLIGVPVDYSAIHAAAEQQAAVKAKTAAPRQPAAQTRPRSSRRPRQLHPPAPRRHGRR